MSAIDKKVEFTVYYMDQDIVLFHMDSLVESSGVRSLCFIYSLEGHRWSGGAIIGTEQISYDEDELKTEVERYDLDALIAPKVNEYTKAYGYPRPQDYGILLNICVASSLARGYEMFFIDNKEELESMLERFPGAGSAEQEYGRLLRDMEAIEDEDPDFRLALETLGFDTDDAILTGYMDLARHFDLSCYDLSKPRYSRFVF